MNTPCRSWGQICCVFNVQITKMEEFTICLKGIRSGECQPQLLLLFDQLQIEALEFRVGFISGKKPLSLKLATLEAQLEALGYVPIKDKQGQLVEQVKQLVFLMLNDDQFQKSRLNVSHHLATQTGKSYAHISRAFSKVSGMTLEKFIIEQRIEQASQLLLNRDLTLVEIASKLGYSSVQHLSRQFHQVTGTTVRSYLQKRNDHGQV